MSLKNNRAAEIIKRASADFLLRESDKTSLITVTQVELSDDSRRARIGVSVYPEDKIKNALDFLKRKQGDMAEYLKKNTRLRRIPHITFAVDGGEHRRERFDDILKKE